MQTSFACVWGLCICECLFVSVWAHVCLCKWMGANAYGSLGVMLAVFLSDFPSHSLRPGVTEASAHECKLCTVTILLCGFPGSPNLHTGISRVSLFGFKLVLTSRPQSSPLNDKSFIHEDTSLATSLQIFIKRIIYVWFCTKTTASENIHCNYVNHSKFYYTPYGLMNAPFSM